MTIDLRKSIKFRNFAELVGQRLYRLGNMEKASNEVKKHYQMIAAKRIPQWIAAKGGLQPEMADTLAFSIHSEAENSWAEIKKEIDDPVILSMDQETDYLDEKAEEEDYIAYLQRKGWLAPDS